MSQKTIEVELVPVEPTERMLIEAAKEDWQFWFQRMSPDHYAALYRAMLRAVPVPSTMSQKNTEDNGGGCSICRSMPAVNVSGSYWLCGECVSERISENIS